MPVFLILLPVLLILLPVLLFFWVVILSEAKNPRILTAAPLHFLWAMREHDYSVYILANTFHRLYIGVTNDLEVRVKQHRSKKDPNSFTARYGIDHLVYFERFQFIQEAIRREKELKSWLRVRKIAFIVQHNPTWKDLSEDWGKPIKPFDERKMRAPETF